MSSHLFVSLYTFFISCPFSLGGTRSLRPRLPSLQPPNVPRRSPPFPHVGNLDTVLFYLESLPFFKLTPPYLVLGSPLSFFPPIPIDNGFS